MITISILSCSTRPKETSTMYFSFDSDPQTQKDKERFILLTINLVNGPSVALSPLVPPLPQNNSQRCQNPKYLRRFIRKTICSNCIIQLGDLGVSKILKNDGGLYSRVGTPLYLAPEIIKYKKYDYKADIWGLGCVCYQLVAMCHSLAPTRTLMQSYSVL